MAALAVLTPMGACAHAFSPSVGDDQTAETPMDLFLGMDYDENYSYMGSDSLLYRFPGLIMVENDALWYDDYDEEDDYYAKFRFSMGLYIDKEYPSEAIFRKMEGAIDSALVFGMEPYGGMDNNFYDYTKFNVVYSHKSNSIQNHIGKTILFGLITVGVGVFFGWLYTLIPIVMFIVIVILDQIFNFLPEFKTICCCFRSCSNPKKEKEKTSPEPYKEHNQEQTKVR